MLNKSGIFFQTKQKSYRTQILNGCVSAVYSMLIFSMDDIICKWQIGRFAEMWNTEFLHETLDGAVQ